MRRLACTLVIATLGAAPVWAQCPCPTGARPFPGFVRIVLPRDDAQLWFGRVYAPGSGKVRLFQTPPLDPSRTFFYTLTAAWRSNGKQVVQRQEAVVQAGKTTVVVFRAGAESPREQPLSPPIAPEPPGTGDRPISPPVAPGGTNEDDRPITPPIAPEQPRLGGSTSVLLAG